ncbi:plasmid stabilization protein [Priestia endophytica]|uniref:plasmid stabilization protein n=1 Tax=Priestia endophytica TaxID=135735 RepID=UPI001F5552E4|nr:plasmid stabilization protein [Priestia endophytica]
MDIPFEQCTGEIGVICMQIQEIEDKGKEKKQTKQIPKKGSRAKKQEESKPLEESKQEQEKKPLLVPKGTKDWMSLDDIKVPETFLQFTPGIAKQKAVEESIEKNGTVDKPIMINPETHELVDSYSRYYVAKQKKLDRVPVHY